MRKYVLDFIRYGLFACGFGPVVLAIVYAFLGAFGVVREIAVWGIVTSVLSVALLAFIAGGINVVYRIERLPLIVAILIHALVLYIDYIAVYVVNGWVKTNITSLVCFTFCFIAGFALIWLVIYFSTKKSTERINAKLDDMHMNS